VTDLIRYDHDIPYVKHGRSMVWAERIGDNRVGLHVHENRRLPDGRINTETAVAITNTQALAISWDIDTAVRLARSTETFSGHPVWCEPNICAMGQPTHHMATLAQMPAGEDEMVEVALTQRYADRRQRVSLYVGGGPVHGEAAVDLTTAEASAVARILRLLGRVR